MPEIFRTLLRLLGLGALYLLASPFLLPKVIRRLRTNLALRKALRDGWVGCSFCRERALLVGQGTCRKCGFTEMGSLLYCSNCKQVASRWIDCRGCHNSIKVW
ncbi:MAG: hypothetical protein L6R30_06515 [Thermoanaerobaculia bacterium]|nr:hypothetical protein [Thermoanaerobaculia bacterium]